VAAAVRWVIKSVVAGSNDARRADQYATDMILVDAPAPGSGKVFDWGLVDDVPEGPRIILAGGLTPENVGGAVQRVRPWGVDVASGVEREPGKKDALKLKAFMANARAAAPQPYLGPDDLPYDWADE
jgi:phosphoribosylanthranilate isomerase